MVPDRDISPYPQELSAEKSPIRTLYISLSILCTTIGSRSKMWCLMLTIFLHVVSLTIALANPIDDGELQSIHPFTQLNVRTLDSRDDNTGLKSLPMLTTIRPRTPYLWQVREVQHQFINFTLYGVEIPLSDGSRFLYAFRHFPLKLLR